MLGDLADQEDLVVHGQPEQGREHHQGHVAGDRHGAVRGREADQVQPPAPLEGRHQDAEGGADAQQVGDGGLHGDQQRAEGDEQQQDAQGQHDQDQLGQLGGDLARQVDVGGGDPADVGGDAALAGGGRDDRGPHLGDQVGGRGVGRPGLGDHGEGGRVPALVDGGRRDQLDVRRRGQGVLELHQAGVGAAVVAAGLGQLVGELLLQLLGLLLLLLRLLLLLLEGVGLGLQLAGLPLQRGALGGQLVGLPPQRGALGGERVRLPPQRGGLGGEGAGLPEQRGGLPGQLGRLPAERGRLAPDLGRLAGQHDDLPLQRLQLRLLGRQGLLGRGQVRLRGGQRAPGVLAGDRLRVRAAGRATALVSARTRSCRVPPGGSAACPEVGPDRRPDDAPAAGSARAVGAAGASGPCCHCRRCQLGGQPLRLQLGGLPRTACWASSWACSCWSWRLLGQELRLLPLQRRLLGLQGVGLGRQLLLLASPGRPGSPWPGCTCPRTPGWDAAGGRSSVAVSRGPLYPGPYALAIRSKACRSVVSFGVVARCPPGRGAARTSGRSREPGAPARPVRRPAGGR